MEERELMMCGRGRRGGAQGFIYHQFFINKFRSEVKIKIGSGSWWVGNGGIHANTMRLLARFSIYSPSAKNEVDSFTVQ